MPTAAIPKQSVTYVTLGTTNVLGANPVLFLKINGAIYSNGYKEYYGGISYRNFFPVYVEETGEVRLYVYALNYGNTLPAVTLTNLEVFLAD